MRDRSYITTNLRYSLITSLSCTFIFCLVIFYSCTTDPGFGNTPEIEFISFSKDTMEQNSLNTDSLFMKISFSDGDGDVGTGSQSVNENIVIIDNRTGDIFERYKLPVIPGADNGIEGEITIKMFTTCCIFPENIPPCLAPPEYPFNSLNFDIYMVDDAGNRSNTVSTDFIVLRCN